MHNVSLSKVVIVTSLILFNILGSMQKVHSAQTSGNVNWIDQASYTKPQFYPITVPDEANNSYKYYVDFTNGSGTTCSQSSPCKDISNVYGKPGTAGGPAYIYLKGSGRLNLTGTLYGSAGKEIVIKPWPGDSSIVTMKTTGGGNVGDANTIKSPNIHHLIVDGGPTMQFDFVGAASPNNQNAYTLVVSSNYVTVARSRIHSAGGYGPALGVGTGPGTYDHIWVINSEIYDANKPGAPYGVYTGGGTGCSDGNTSHNYVYFLNNIVRNICGRGIQIEPRNSASFTYVDGNAFHDTGTNSCGFGQVSGAVQPASSCGGDISNTYIRNNLMFNLGGGGVNLVIDERNTYVLNNTIYDYAMSTPLSTGSHGITCYSDGCRGTVENNIILQTNASGINPINRGSGFTTSSNLCESGKTCGNASRTGTRDNTFVSYNTGSPDFLKLKASSPAINNGINLFGSGVTIDYKGISRPSIGAFDIGAMDDLDSLNSYLSSPTNLRILP